jgi:hypothetical protein
MELTGKIPLEDTTCVCLGSGRFLVRRFAFRQQHCRDEKLMR